MANGAAVALSFEPPSHPAPASAAEGIEGLIGEVLTKIAGVSVQAYREVQAGQMSRATKTQGGELISLLYQARQALGATGFVDTMHRQSRVLRQRPGVELSEVEAAEIADDLIAVVVKVDAVMRAGAH